MLRTLTRPLPKGEEKIAPGSVTQMAALPPDVRKGYAFASLFANFSYGATPRLWGIARNELGDLPEGQRPSAHQAAKPHVVFQIDPGAVPLAISFQAFSVMKAPSLRIALLPWPTRYRRRFCNRSHEDAFIPCEALCLFVVVSNRGTLWIFFNL